MIGLSCGYSFSHKGKFEWLYDEFHSLNKNEIQHHHTNF